MKEQQQELNRRMSRLILEELWERIYRHAKGPTNSCPKCGNAKESCECEDRARYVR